MYEMRELLRLHFELHLSYRDIGKSLGISHVTVSDCLRRFRASGGSWPLTSDMTEEQLRAKLYPGSLGRPQTRPEPDWPTIHADLRRHRQLTLELVWMEYKEQHSGGLQYTQFCAHYRNYVRSVDLVFRRVYHPGQQMQVDFAGDQLTIYDAHGTVRYRASLFVAVLPYSNYFFVGVYPDQTLASWIRGHVDAFTAFEGVPRMVVPDNPRALVTDARGDIVLNPTYQALGEHYHCGLVPARVRKPKDKAKAENHVLLAERWILMALRHDRITSIADAQSRVSALNARLNDRPFQKWPGTRREWWREEHAQLQPLPATPFTYAIIRMAKVGPDYHVHVDRSAYSVPHTLVGKTVEVRMSALTVECFANGQRVASHPRAMRPGYWSTHREHMPPHHQAVQQGWSRETFVRRAQQIGPATTQLIETILNRASIPEQVYTRCRGILRLARDFTPVVVEEAAQRALHAELLTVKGVRLFCEKAQAASADATETRPGHANTRGAKYYADSASIDAEGRETT